MTAAIAAATVATAGCRVTVIEQLPNTGTRLLATGGGRCNLTNTATSEEFCQVFGRQGRFTQPAIDALGPDALREMLGRFGLQTRCENSFAIYPASNRAIDVRDTLVTACKRLGVSFLTGSRVENIAIDGGRVTGLETAAGHINARAVIIAAGGCSYPALGGGRSGMDLARVAGHRIVEPIPSLVGLVTKERWGCGIAGVSVPGANIRIDLPRQSKAGVTGDLLFTHAGLSGPAVLNMSGDIAQMLRKPKQKEVPLRINFIGDLSRDACMAIFASWQRDAGTKSLRKLVAHNTALAGSLVDVLLGLADIEAETTAAHVSGKQRETLAGLLCACPLTITRTEGFDKAMVTRGGVALKQIDPHTLASRIVDGVFFAGEILDMDGPCGGYNLQWAFASGYLAGQSAGRWL